MWFHAPANVVERLRSTRFRSPLGSDGFSGQTLLGNRQPGMLRGRGRRGVIIHSFTLMDTTNTTGHPPPHKSSSIQPHMNRCPQVKSSPCRIHTANTPTQQIIPQTSPVWGSSKIPTFLFKHFGFEKTPSKCCQIVRIIRFMRNLREIQSTCCWFVRP